jgi:hypothetical protein
MTKSVILAATGDLIGCARCSKLNVSYLAVAHHDGQKCSLPRARLSFGPSSIEGCAFRPKMVFPKRSAHGTPSPPSNLVSLSEIVAVHRSPVAAGEKRTKGASQGFRALRPTELGRGALR